jgi:nucleoside-diphosphate-sugar epimerase
MNVLIAGGAGFIGSNLVKFHLDQSDTVYAIDNLITGTTTNIDSSFKNENFHFIQDDIASYNFAKLPRFDLVYHLASPASPIQYKKHPLETLKANSLGTLNLLNFFLESHSGSFVLASTSETYGDPLIHPQTEEYWGNVNPIGIRSCYDESKRFAESLAMTFFRLHHLNIRIARIFNTYGEKMEKNDGRVVSNFIFQAISNQPITVYGQGTQTRSFCYVSDMVKGLHLLGTVPNIAGQVINLGNPNEKSILQLANLIKELTKSNSSIVFHPIDDDDPQKRRPDINKAKKILGWTPQVSLKEGLLKTIIFFRERYL